MGYKSMYTSGPISIRSTCAHHLQNIVGKAWVGIIPNGEVIGLSKFNRIVHHIVAVFREAVVLPTVNNNADVFLEEESLVKVVFEHHYQIFRDFPGFSKFG